MTKLPDVVKEAWEDRNGAIVFTTVSPEGMPNAIYASCVKIWDDSHVVVADNFFNKTRANIAAGSKGALVLITNAGKSYQIKGSLEYLTSGEIYDDMQEWVNCKLPRVAAAVIDVEEVYSGSEKLA